MKLKLLDRLGRLLLPEKNSSALPKLVMAIALLVSLSGWSQCAPVISGTSNITATTATINWNAVVDFPTTTYTLEVYTNAALTTSFGSYPAVTTTSFNLTNLVVNTTYYFRVKTNNVSCADFSATGSFVAQLGYTPLDVTGFTADVIANGIGAAATTSTHSVDSQTANNAYFCIDYKPLSTSNTLTFGLPVNRTLTSANPTDLKFLLSNYSGNNSLRLSATNDFGTLAFAQPQKLTNLYLAAASGDGASTINIEIQFADGGASQTVTNQSITNWDVAPVAPITILTTGIGRVNRGDNVTSGSSNTFRIYQIGIAIDAANQNRTISAIKITKSNTSNPESQIPNIFAISGKLTPACPVVASPTAAATTPTSATISWTLGTLGTNAATGATATYTVEVYTDATYTTPITGSPFTGITALNKVVTGLALNTTYYFKVKASNGTCEGDYVTGPYSHAYCAPTVTTVNSNIITNFTTTGGYLNIANTSTNAAYADFTTQVVSKMAGATFNFTGVKSVTTTRIGIYVDWNQDLDFTDTGETVYTLATSSNTAFNGTITIPAGTPLGNYRMRVRSSSATVTPCGNLTNGDTEEYTLTVAAAPAPCLAPATPTLTVSTPTATGMSVTAASGTAPTGYVLVRSTEATLSAPLVDVVEYTPGTSVGNGIVVAVAPTISGFVDFAAPNTRYYYYAFAYNNGGATCLGPIYSTTPGIANGTTCAKAVVNAAASNITSTSALLNWSSVVGSGGAAATYTVEVYTDAALTTMFGTAHTVVSPAASYALTGLTNGVTYYYRVKTQTAACFLDTWSATASFIAQNNYTPFTVTGFNDDVIANGTGIAKASTTAAVDVVSNAYMAIDYERATGIVTTVGLPLNRTLSSILVPTLNFLFADYSTNNALRIPAQNQVGSLTLTTPKRLTNVYLALTSGSGASTISSKINFQDGTSQAPVTSTTLIDWYNAGTTAQPFLIQNIGRVNRADNNGAFETGAAKVFYVDIPVLAENQSKLVASVEITKTSTGDATVGPVPNIFAISGKQIDECPVLTAATAVPTGTSAAISWGLATGSAAATSYTLEVYTNAAYTTHVTGSPFTVTTGTTFNVTGLAPLTPYYFRVKGTSAVCASAYQTGTFTTTCVASAAPVAPASQPFCVASTVANLVATPLTGATLNWYNVATAGTALTSTTALATGTYYVSQSLNGCESPRTPVAVTVTILTAPTAAPQTVCVGVTFNQLVVTGATGATFTWSATQGGTAIAGTTAVTPGTYFVIQTVGTCTSTATSVVLNTTTINAPTAPAQAQCTGTTFAQLNVTGATGATFTWSATQGGTAIAGTTVATSGTYFVTQTVGTCTSSATSVLLTINTTPAPTASTQTRCAGTTVADLVATGVAGGTFTWSLTSGGAALATTTPLVFGTYFVKQTLNGCVSTATPVTVIVNSIAAPVAAATQTVCAGATVGNLTATAVTGATVKWSATEGGAALATTTTLVAGTYYVTQTQNTCESTATPVTVIINNTTAPEASEQFFCIGAVASALQATTLPGAIVVWSATEGGAALNANTVLATGTYYVTQSLNGCVSIATPVSVVVNSTPAPGASDQAFCVGATVNQLVASNVTGATVKWFTTVGGTALDASTLLVSGTYYVTQTLNLCESTATQVNVTINTVVAPTANTQTLCAGATVNDLSATGTTGATFTWYATEGGSALADTTVLVSATYYVTQTVGDCTSIATPVVVVINAVPNAPGGSATQTFVEGSGDTIADLVITTASGATVQWYVLEDDVYVAVDTDTALENNTTYYVSQTTTACESSKLAVTVSSVTGRDTFKFANLVVYPNPTKDIVTVSNSATISKVTVVNLLGQTVIEQKATTDTVQVNLSSLPAGHYILQVNAEGASTSVKVIKH